MFEQLEMAPADPILGLSAAFKSNSNPDKINLGVGVYQDSSGQTPILDSVKTAEERILANEKSKSYLSIEGSPEYGIAVRKLLLGPEHEILSCERAVTVQSPGGTGALRIAGDFLARHYGDRPIWLSEPTWANHPKIFQAAGLQVETYPYFDAETNGLNESALLTALTKIPEGHIVLLHGCCHNPTGEDPDLAQWQTIADLINEKRVLPLVDIAYQGFGSGIEEDVAGVRLLAAQVSELILTVSSSKSFGIYRERAGLLSIIHQKQASGDSLKRKLRDTLRQLYFMAPNHGAAVVHEILSSQTLEQLWRDELNAVRHQVVAMRVALKATLEQANPEFDASFIPRQKGMFSCLPLSEAQQLRMEQQYHIYMLPNARVNVAAMSVEQSQALASAFAGILSE